MAAKDKQGNDIYDLLIGLILELSPNAARRLYNEVKPRYSKNARNKIKLYNQDGQLDPLGKVRLTEYQYKAMRLKFGDSYIRKAFTELTSYITFLENHQDESKYRSSLTRYNTGSHNVLLTEDWVFNKCKQYISKEPPKVCVNPYMIDDYNTAKEYVKNINKALWETALDVRVLFIKFPQLKDDIQEDNQ